LERKSVIIQGFEGLRAYNRTEAEALLRCALTATDTPWLSTWHIGEPSGEHIIWYPCSLLVSAAHHTDHVALQYQSWELSTQDAPRLAFRESRRRWNEHFPNPQGTWISHNPHGTTPLPRPSNTAFPRTAAIPALDAARAIRAFYHTGHRTTQIHWCPDSFSTTTTVTAHHNLATI
jgi:hypothetical protein